VGPRVIPDLNFSTSPTSPKTPGGGRLSEKLKGLKLGTSVSALSGPSGNYLQSIFSLTRANKKLVTSESAKSEHPLSPDLGDVAVSSFALFHGATTRTQSRTVAQNPPDFLVAQQSDSRGGSRINSLDAVTRGDIPKRDDNETEDGLFAVRLSPRSPEMTKSPFSFAAKDTVPWLKDNE